MVKNNFGLEILCHKQTIVVSIFSSFLHYQHPLIKIHLFKHQTTVTYVFCSFLHYQHPLIKIHLFKHETTVTYVSWMVSKQARSQDLKKRGGGLF